MFTSNFIGKVGGLLNDKIKKAKSQKPQHQSFLTLREKGQ